MPVVPGADEQAMQEACDKLARAWGARRAWLVALPAAEAMAEAVHLPAGSCAAEPLTGTPIECVDLRAVGHGARESGVAFMVDNTLPGAAGCAAVRLGAHVAYAALGEDLCAWAVSRDAERVLPGIAERLSALPQAGGDALEEARERIDRGVREWRASSDAAQVVAAYLTCHPRVAEVRYPGLKSDPSFEVAARTLQRGFGPVVDFRLHGEREWERRICDSGDERGLVMSIEQWLSAR